MSAYVGVDNIARKIKSIYVGVDGVARKVKKAYVGVDGVARQIFSSGGGEIVGTDDIYIAYIVDGDNGATYTFYDADGKEVEPTVGQAIRSYTIEGTPTFDKYYCLYSLTKTWYESTSVITYWSSNLYGSTQGTSTNFGTGKANTKLCIPKNTDTYSVFYEANQMNADKVYGYDDWFVLSKDELSNAAASVQSAVSSSIFNRSTVLWSSSEYSSKYAWCWYVSGISSDYRKTVSFSWSPARAF